MTNIINFLGIIWEWGIKNAYVSWLLMTKTPIRGNLKKINTSRYWTKRGSNPRPLRYKHNALTNCAISPYTYLPYINICLSYFKRTRF